MHKYKGAYLASTLRGGAMLPIAAENDGTLLCECLLYRFVVH